MAKSSQTDQVEALEVEAQHQQGIRTRKAIMMREFLPSQEWVAGVVVAKGKGTKVMLGAIHGVVMETEDREGTLPNGQVKMSTICKGTFESTNFVTGEISRASSVYFPEAFAQEIKTLFASDENLKLVKVDVDVGVEATGKTPPYTWIVIQYAEAGHRDVLSELRNARKRLPPTNIPLLTQQK